MSPGLIRLSDFAESLVQYNKSGLSHWLTSSTALMPRCWLCSFHLTDVVWRLTSRLPDSTCCCPGAQWRRHCTVFPPGYGWVTSPAHPSVLAVTQFPWRVMLNDQIVMCKHSKQFKRVCAHTHTFIAWVLRYQRRCLSHVTSQVNQVNACMRVCASSCWLGDVCIISTPWSQGKLSTVSEKTSSVSQ